MECLQIQYLFRFPDKKHEIFNLALDPLTLELINNNPLVPAPWSRLEFHQCTNCSLSPGTHPDCPLSLNLVDLVVRLGNVLSYDQVSLEVRTPDRCTSLDVTAQAGVSSLMGLIMATSGCPHTVFFRPMARFHQPLAGEEETLYRAAGMYLLAQYFLKKEGKNATFEFDGLERIYEDIQIMNEGIAERLKSAVKSDLSANAVTRLDLYAKIFPFLAQDKLKNIRYLFSAYLTGDQGRGFDGQGVSRNPPEYLTNKYDELPGSRSQRNPG